MLDTCNLRKALLIWLMISGVPRPWVWGEVAIMAEGCLRVEPHTSWRPWSRAPVRDTQSWDPASGNVSFTWTSRSSSTVSCAHQRMNLGMLWRSHLYRNLLIQSSRQLELMDTQDLTLRFLHRDRNLYINHVYTFLCDSVCLSLCMNKIILCKFSSTAFQLSSIFYLFSNILQNFPLLTLCKYF